MSSSALSDMYKELAAAVARIEILAQNPHSSLDDVSYCADTLRRFLTHPQIVETPIAYLACESMIAQCEELLERCRASRSRQ